MALKLFSNPEFGEIRTTQVEGKVMFCGKDIASALGYANTKDALAKHCKSDGVANLYPIVDSLGRTQKARFITEGDIYRLIIHSRLPNAERFESWVFDEVLPSIRETGGYIAGEESMDEDELVLKAITVLQAKLEKKNKELKEMSNKNKSLEIRLDTESEWYSIKRYAKEHEVMLKWKPLKEMSKKMGYEIKKAFDANYGEVNTYHKKVFMAVIKNMKEIL